MRDTGEATDGPILRYHRRLSDTLSEDMMCALSEVARPSMVVDILLAAYQPPFVARVGGRTMATSVEACRFNIDRLAGHCGVDLRARDDDIKGLLATVCWGEDDEDAEDNPGSDEELEQVTSQV